MARDLQVVNGVAIALIAFIAGLEINFTRLRPQLRAMLTMGGVMLGLMWVTLSLLFFLAWPWMPILPGATGLARLALAGLAATVVASFSPTVTIAVIAESRARGPLCELVLALVVLADLALVLLFTLSIEGVRLALGTTAGGGAGVLSGLAWEIFGSFAFGAIVGALLAFYLRYVGREVTVVLLGISALLSQVGAGWHFEPLLAALAAGLVVENIAPPEGDALRVAVERGALPILVLFFAAAGANLETARADRRRPARRPHGGRARRTDPGHGGRGRAHRRIDGDRPVAGLDGIDLSGRRHAGPRRHHRAGVPGVGAATVRAHRRDERDARRDRTNRAPFGAVTGRRGRPDGPAGERRT